MSQAAFFHPETQHAKAELVVHVRNQVGESPVWNPDDGALYWVDIPLGALHRWSAASGLHTCWQGSQALACIARRPGGGWLGAMENGIYALSLAGAQELQAHVLAPVRHEGSGMRFNDGRCDRQGRLWVGSQVMDVERDGAAGALYRYDPDDDGLTRYLGGLYTSNGLAFSPDGRRMYLSDSHPRRACVWVFDYDPDDGVPANQRLFIPKLASGRPDGAAVDVDGCYWICGNDAGEIHRYTPEGKLDRSLSVPVPKPSMCAFGGRHLDTLFVTSIRRSESGPLDLDGGVFALRPGVCGLPEPAFKK